MALPWSCPCSAVRESTRRHVLTQTYRMGPGLGEGELFVPASVHVVPRGPASDDHSPH